jgi:cytochrome c oxidase subunit II
MKHNKLSSALLVCAAGVASTAALAGYDVLNLPPGATATARSNYSLHVFVLWICVGIFVVVFGAMFYSIIKHRKSVGHKAEHFHENTTIEILWTAIPFIIIAVLTAKATGGLLTLRDTSKPDMTIKITAHQWQWKYDYLQDGVSFYSKMSTPREQIETSARKGPNYVVEVDKEMVVPTNKKIRLLITSNDVIHGWYMPDFAVNQYGIPGFIKDTYINVEKPGVYRGQCSQICGKEHAFMPIVVRAVSDDEYKAWVEKTKAGPG